MLHEVFHALHRHAVVLEHMLLKPSMVLPGKETRHAAPAEVAAETVQVLKRTVQAAVPGVFFLSGGQTPTEATANFDAMNRLAPLPWRLAFSYGRALQEPPLLAWHGEAASATDATAALTDEWHGLPGAIRSGARDRCGLSSRQAQDGKTPAATWTTEADKRDGRNSQISEA